MGGLFCEIASILKPAEFVLLKKVGRAPLYKRWKKGEPVSFDFAREVPTETRTRIRLGREGAGLACVRVGHKGLARRNRSDQIPINGSIK